LDDFVLIALLEALITDVADQGVDEFDVEARIMQLRASIR
jgi:hypothetical protein